MRFKWKTKVSSMAVQSTSLQTYDVMLTFSDDLKNKDGFH